MPLYVVGGSLYYRENKLLKRRHQLSRIILIHSNVIMGICIMVSIVSVESIDFWLWFSKIFWVTQNCKQLGVDFYQYRTYC